MTLARNKLKFFFLWIILRRAITESNHWSIFIELDIWLSNFAPKGMWQLTTPAAMDRFLLKMIPLPKNSAALQRLCAVPNTTLPPPEGKPVAGFTAYWGFDWDGVKLMYRVGRVDLLMQWSLLIHEHGISHPSLRPLYLTMEFYDFLQRDLVRVLRGLWLTLV